MDFVVFDGREYPVNVIEPQKGRWDKEIRQLTINNPNIRNINRIQGLEKLTNLTRLYINGQISEIKGLDN